jgi:hypothetical protein
MVRQQERAFLIYSFSAAILAGYGAIILTGPLTKSARQRYVKFESAMRTILALSTILTLFFIYGSTASTARGDEVNLFYGVLRHHLFGLLIIAVMTVLLMLRTRRWLRRSWGMMLIAAWLIFNLFTINWQFNLEKPTTPGPFVPEGVVQFLQGHVPPGRIVSGGLLSGGNSAGSVYELPDLTGNTPLQLATVDQFLQQLPAWRMWQLMNVRYVVDDRDISNAGLEVVFSESKDDGEIYIFEMTDPFPKAWFVNQVENITDTESALNRLASDEFPLRERAILAEPDYPMSFQTNGRNPYEFTNQVIDSNIDIIEQTPTHLQINLSTTGQQLLVISQIYYPGWQARLDGQPVELHRVNVVQQGVIMPPGEHTLDLIFWPTSFWLGGIISIAGIILLLLSSTAPLSANTPANPTGAHGTGSVEWVEERLSIFA